MGIGFEIWKSAFRADTKGGGATAARANQTWTQLDKFVEKNHWKNVTPGTITPKQMRLFLEFRKTEISARSLQNEASHLRRAIQGAGRDLGTIRDPKNGWGNVRMGVESASRFGGKSAMSSSVFESARERLRDDVRVCVDLQKVLGLRRLESIQAGASLGRWREELERAKNEGHGAFVAVVDGTKGGRERSTFVPADRVQKVLDVVIDAQASMTGKFIIDGASLEAVKTIYSNALSRCGLTGDNSGHGLRRGFAQEQYAGYRESGLDEADALARLSRDLGHGDGRGRWVWNNYLAGGEGV